LEVLGVYFNTPVFVLTLICILWLFFKTWDEQKSFADGPSILKNNEAADEYKVRNNIIYQQRALCYNFDTKEKLWTITTENTSTAEETIYTCQFIFSCSGYYNYTKGYTRIYRSIEV
jgi:cation diffusion facilitator CzcD-associated flavoprotein CzcO